VEGALRPGHAQERVPAEACPRLIRANGGHRPAIHSPQEHPPEIGGVSAAEPRFNGAPPCLPIGSGSIALDQPSGPAGEARGVVVPSGQRRSCPRCSRGRTSQHRLRARDQRRLGRRFPGTGGAGRGRRRRAFDVQGGLILRYQSWTMPRRAPAPCRATVLFASLVRRERKPTPGDAT
jgi:hypothetical protein